MEAVYLLDALSLAAQNSVDVPIISSTGAFALEKLAEVSDGSY